MAGIGTLFVSFRDDLLTQTRFVNSEFDGKDFVSGVQLMATSYSTVMQGGSGQVNGVNVLKSVVNNPNIYA